jgi:hypothetical protein
MDNRSRRICVAGPFTLPEWLQKIVRDLLNKAKAQSDIDITQEKP